MNQEIKLPELEDFEPSCCLDISRPSKKGGLSIVYSNSGKRLILSSATMELLDQPDAVQFAYSEGIIAIAKYIGTTHTDYALKSDGKRGIIYNTELIKEIIGYYKLKYQGRTSITFPILQTQKKGDHRVLFINMQESSLNK